MKEKHKYSMRRLEKEQEHGREEEGEGVVERETDRFTDMFTNKGLKEAMSRSKIYRPNR